MTKNIFFIMIFILLIACGEEKDPYKEYGDTGDTGNSGNSGNTGNTGDTGNTGNTGNTGDSGDTGDTGNTGNTGDTGNTAVDWSTCEGIIICTYGCADFDELCESFCYNDGSNEGQSDYRKWKECFENNCSETPTFECSEEKCPEQSAICGVSSDDPVPQPFPAPYGTVDISAEFTFIVNNGAPSGESEFLSRSFVTGKISKIDIAPPSADLIISYVNYSQESETDTLEIFQIPMLEISRTIINPLVLMTITVAKASKGTHSIGLDSATDAKLMLINIDENDEIKCHYAFAIGSFEITKAVIVAGTDGRLSLSGSEIELFSPRNIPAYGGDAQDYLDVTSCSMIK
ncbi:MAG TPA: hypothetical protein VLJ60_04760 [bacterium]|nr:hypothetical protein [bacterium]